MNTKILRLNKAGSPTAWINFEEAATVIAKGQVIWSMGELADTLRGGYRLSGKRSFMDLPAIIAVDGRVKEKEVPRMSNRLLFARDQHTCMYCGNEFSPAELSRDHVIPQSQNGPDTWENCVTACKRDNHHKRDRTPEQAGMELLAVPFAPNLHEWFYLSNRNVLADQMEYLKSKFQNVLVA